MVCVVPYMMRDSMHADKSVPPASRVMCVGGGGVNLGAMRLLPEAPLACPCARGGQAAAVLRLYNVTRSHAMRKSTCKRRPGWRREGGKGRPAKRVWCCCQPAAASS